MKYFQPLPLEVFINRLTSDDREVGRVVESLNIEREEVVKILTAHYKELGIYLVRPLEYAEALKADAIFQLGNNKLIKQKVYQVQKQIALLKQKYIDDDP